MEIREYKKVIEYVKDEIRQGRIRLEDKLPAERIMAETLDMSRNSVREALRTMENMGILESKQGSGNYLTGNLNKMFAESIGMMLLLKQITYDEVNSLRRAIERESYLQAITNISQNQIEQLVKILETMKRSEIDEMVQKDKEFHYLIISASGNNLVINIMEALEEIYTESVEHMLKTTTDEIRGKLILSHEKMLECIVKKDEAKGRQAVDQHYDIIESWYKKM